MMPAPQSVQSTPDGTEISGDAGKSGAECSRIEVKKTANGGFTATCYYKPKADKGPKDRGPSYIDPDDYAFSTFAELATWMAKELGGAPAPAQQPAPDASAAGGDEGDY